MRPLPAVICTFALVALLLCGCGKPAGTAEPPVIEETSADAPSPTLAENETRASAAGKQLEAMAKKIAAGDPPHENLAFLAAPFAGSVQDTRHSEAHVFDVRRDGDRFSTVARIEVAARIEGKGHRAAVAHLAAEWQVKPGGDKITLTACEIRGEPQIAESPAPWFSDHTTDVMGGGSAFHNHLAHGLDHWLARIEAVHGMDAFIRNGMALGDADGDGLDDIYVCQPGGLPNRLFLHQPDGTAKEIAAEAGVDLLDHTSAALFIDLDNDGDGDLVLATPAGVILLENDGAATFAARGILSTDSFDCHALAAADYDLDGDLDLYVTFALGDQFAGVEPGTFQFHDARNGGYNQLFRNDGKWSFSEATGRSGLDAGNDRHSVAATWHDYDLDGDPDLYVANDYGPNQLYRNDDAPEPGRRTFTEVAAELGVQDYGAGMSASWGDYDRDGRPDLYVGNIFSNAGHRIAYQEGYLGEGGADLLAVYQRFAKGNTLFTQNEDGKFAEFGEEVEMGRWAWSSVFADLDNDGWEDLFVANGNITGPDAHDLGSFFWQQVVPLRNSGINPGLEASEPARELQNAMRRGESFSGRERHVVFHNRFGDAGRKRGFVDVSGVTGLDLPDDGRAACFTDWDGDGDLDLWTSNRSGPQLRFFQNDNPAGGRGLTLRLLGQSCNRDAIGARAVLHFKGSDRIQSRTVTAGSGFLTQSSKTLHFGLGDGAEVEKAEIHWPGDEVQEIALPEPGLYLVTQGQQPRRGGILPPAPPETIADIKLPPLPPPPDRTFLAGRPPVGTIFPRPEGSDDKPLLVSLTSATCPNCIAQLAAWKNRPPEGVVLQVLSIERLQAEEPQRLLSMRRAHDQPFDIKDRQMPAPLSFLIDANDRLRAIYRGRVDAGTLAGDITNLSLEGEALSAASLPFPGITVAGAISACCSSKAPDDGP